MTELEMACMEIIAFVGEARSLYIEAIHCAKNGAFEQAKALVQDGDEAFKKGHYAHTKLIQKDATEHAISMTMLLTHAQDQLMSAEAFQILCGEFIDVYQTIQTSNIKKN